jgi:hypothetical protein
MEITENMIYECEMNPTWSRTHEFVGDQKAHYDMLTARGRTLYDNLRTLFDVGHADAWWASYDRFGIRPETSAIWAN